MMRHVYIRGILSCIWFVAAIVCGVSGKMEMAAFYVLAGLACMYSAYDVWKKHKGGKGVK